MKQLVALLRRQEGSANLDHQAVPVVLTTSVYVRSPGGGCPVRAGIKRDWMAFSKDSRMPSSWFFSQSVTSSTLKIAHG